MDNNGVIQACLKRKLNFKSHVLFEAVRLTLVRGVLNFLKKNNLLYYDIDINLDNIPRKWVNTIESNENENISEFNTPNENIINRDHITFIDDNQPWKNRDFNINDEISVEKDDIEEENNLLDDYRMLCFETLYVEGVQYALRDDAGIAIALRENKIPLPIISDKTMKF